MSLRKKDYQKEKAVAYDINSMVQRLENNNHNGELFRLVNENYVSDSTLPPLFHSSIACLWLRETIFFPMLTYHLVQKITHFIQINYAQILKTLYPLPFQHWCIKWVISSVLASFCNSCFISCSLAFVSLCLVKLSWFSILLVCSNSRHISKSCDNMLSSQLIRQMKLWWDWDPLDEMMGTQVLQMTEGSVSDEQITHDYATGSWTSSAILEQFVWIL